jgi:DNA-directed RNA polymerase specialized sigma24 family protein
VEFDEYVVARRAALVRSAVLLGCPRPDAEDVVQTALLRCYRPSRDATSLDATIDITVA